MHAFGVSVRVVALEEGDLGGRVNSHRRRKDEAVSRPAFLALNFEGTEFLPV